MEEHETIEKDFIEDIIDKFKSDIEKNPKLKEDILSMLRSELINHGFRNLLELDGVSEALTNCIPDSIRVSFYQTIKDNK